MLFLYDPVPYLVRKANKTTGLDSFFDDIAADLSGSGSSQRREKKRPNEWLDLGRVEDRKNNIDENNNKHHNLSKIGDGTFQVTLDVPGYKSADLQVTLDPRTNVLTIRGETPHRMFRKTLSVHNARFTDLSHLTAQMSNHGVLTLTAPPKTPPTPVPIPVTTNTDIHGDDTINEDTSCNHQEAKSSWRRFTIELPGVQHSDLQLTLEEGTTLHVRGVRRDRDQSFHKTLRIVPDVLRNDLINTEELTANLSHGILTVQAPPLPTPQPQTVAIETDRSFGTITTTESANKTDHTMTDNATVLTTIDLPGVGHSGINVSTVQVDQHHTLLDVRAARNNQTHGNKKWRISKSVLVDHDMYNLDTIKAQLANGVLTITAIKKPEAMARAIPIVLVADEAQVGCC
jgi:HSP20 family molecular chaperone IbpA